ncbi:hypothetical protein BDW59DRAFT_158293 [Aspergillus cavernicola]|uniref:Uncharacterized protein n=1 Tax=Aspergillus cavernicola TaxID=176166 RepID=A0ABR4ISW0_9EURO
MRPASKATRKSSPMQPNSSDRRYSARYLVLIYRETRAHFDPLEIQRLVAREQAKCTIVRRARGDDTAVSSYSAFVDFSGKRFQTRNLALFDVQGYRPKWIHVTSSPWRTLDEMIAQGDVVVWNGIVRPSTKHTGGRKPAPATSSKMDSSSSSPWELVGSATSEASFRELLRKELSAEAGSEPPEEQPSFDRVEDCSTIVVAGETEMARNVQYWQDGYRAGYKAASSAQGPTLNISKAPGAPCEDNNAHFFPSSDGGPHSDVFQEFSQVDLDWNFELDDIWDPQPIK